MVGLWGHLIPVPVRSLPHNELPRKQEEEEPRWRRWMSTMMMIMMTMTVMENTLKLCVALPCLLSTSTLVTIFQIWWCQIAPFKVS